MHRFLPSFTASAKPLQCVLKGRSELFYVTEEKAITVESNGLQ